jgi:RAB protein geranylgeranyltransferase component A
MLEILQDSDLQRYSHVKNIYQHNYYSKTKVIKLCKNRVYKLNVVDNIMRHLYPHISNTIGHNI